jgi:hypothetical protein
VSVAKQERERESGRRAGAQEVVRALHIQAQREEEAVVGVAGKEPVLHN